MELYLRDENNEELWSVARRTSEEGLVIAVSTPYLTYDAAEALADAIKQVNSAHSVE